jgi:S-adenosylmethionine:tRNA ribosyltransferase-isomerase
MKTSEFDYNLPEELIAQYPLEQRDACRMLHLNRQTGAVTDSFFCQLKDFLQPGDRLVFNDTKVIPTRLFCKKKTGGAVELLLTEPASPCSWKALSRPGKGIIAGTKLFLKANETIELKILSVDENGMREVAVCSGSKSLSDIIQEYGVMALPRYIKRDATAADVDTYQTVFARNQGAIACPTAGLHFTTELIQKLQAEGVDVSYVTLHVGIGTFKPVSVDDPEKHPMHAERYSLSDQTVQEIQATKKNGGRIVAVGTTVVRVLEHCSQNKGILTQSQGETRLLILPGYQFKTVDAIITNFHVPKSTLLMLISAFAGKEHVFNAYRHAVEKKYRFFSYGDSMIIA